MMQQVQTNYYTIAKPMICGDLVLIIRGGTNVLHSAVLSCRRHCLHEERQQTPTQPWTLMRLKDLLATYDQDDATDPITSTATKMR